MSATILEDDELRAFAEGEIDPKKFPHREHVRFGFEMLARYPFAETLQRFSAGLKVLAAKAGKPQFYHETKTVAFLALIAERRSRGHADSWEEFVGANPDLLDKRCLEKVYRADDLESETARAVFVLPRTMPRPDWSVPAFGLVFSLYIIWSSGMTFSQAHGHNSHLSLLAAVEIVAAILFCFRRTRTLGLLFLLAVFVLATVAEIISGGVPVRFFYFAASALLVWWLTRPPRARVLA